MNKVKFIFIILLSFILCSCHNENETTDSVLESESVVTYSAQCQSDTVRFSTQGNWTAQTDCEWITLAFSEGKGSGEIPVYIQQNDGDGIRKATLSIDLEDGTQLKVAFTQSMFDINSGVEVNLPRNFGLGWGYDYTVDHADVSGLRGQVFDVQALKNNCGEDPIILENQTGTQLYYASEHTVQRLQQKMTVALVGEIDLLVAGARVSSEFSKQTEEQKECLMIWSRDCKYVKQGYFSGNVDLYARDVINACSTLDFRNSVKNDSPQDFVRKYGTHLIVNTFLGGRLDYFFSVSSDVTTETSALVTTVSAKFLFWNKQWTSKEEKIWQEVKTEFEGNFYIAGGGEYEPLLNEEFKSCIARGEPISNTDMLDSWQNCFVNADKAKDEDLTMVDFQVIPIWDIVYSMNETKAEEIKDYIESYYAKR